VPDSIAGYAPPEAHGEDAAEQVEPEEKES
jgi:hypothetical protein